MERIAQMAENVVEGMGLENVAQSPDDDDALAMVDQAIDAMVAATQIIDENLSKVKIENVPQKAAVDAVKDLMDTAIRPYLADIIRVMSIFDEVGL